MFDSVNGDVDLKRTDITENGVPFITSGLENCGVAGLTDRKARIIPSNTITIDMFGNAFYRDFAYKMVTHARVFALLPKFKGINEHIGLYLTGALSFLPNMFNYSNMCSYAKISDLTIKLPATPEGSPDWNYMDAYISELEQERISELDAYLKATGLDDYELTEEDREILASAVGGGADSPSPMFGSCSPKWARKFKDFPVEDLFKMQVVSHKLSKSDLESNAKYPCYSSDTNNNGILGYTSSPDFYVSKDVKTYVIFGDHTRTFNIATTDFSVLDNVKVLVPPTNNIEAIMFMTSVWKKQVPNRGYARHWSLAKQAVLNLPVDSDGNPDFKYMERYIKAMEKVVIVDVVAYKNKVIESAKKVVGV